MAGSVQANMLHLWDVNEGCTKPALSSRLFGGVSLCGQPWGVKHNVYTGEKMRVVSCYHHTADY